MSSNTGVELFLFSVFGLRKESAVCVIQASWVTAASLIYMMTVEQGSGGVWVKETPTCLPGRVQLACTCLPLEPCTYLEVRVACCQIPLIAFLFEVCLIITCFPPGFDLNRALGDLIKYNFTSNQWESRSYGYCPVSFLLILRFTQTHTIFSFSCSCFSYAVFTSTEVAPFSLLQ